MLRIGSPLISRAGWLALLEAQGFHSCVVAGSTAAAPPLLARQSVVVGVSDGIVRLSTATRARADAASSSTADPELPPPIVKHADMMQVCCAVCRRTCHPAQDALLACVLPAAASPHGVC